MSPPTPDEVRAARLAAGLTQAQAAELVHYGRALRWSDLECGRHAVPAAVWELFQIKTGTHPAFRPVKARS